MKESSDPGLNAARKMLNLADEAMKKEKFEVALKHVRRVYDSDPRNMYARAYEERILMAMAEKKAQKSAELLISSRMRSFIAAQETADRSTASHPAQPSLPKSREKLDSVIKEIETGTHEARERLFELLLQKAADPAETVERARATVTDLSDQYRQRLERIKNLMIEHEKELVQSLEKVHVENARKLYRSIVYMLQKLGVQFQHREPLLHLVAFFGQLGKEDEKELRHSALLGIYEDLLKQLYIQEGPSQESLDMLDKTREDFGVSETEHDRLVQHAKNELLVTEHQPRIAVVEGDQKLAERISKAIGMEFPKVAVRLFKDPEEFLSASEKRMPDILISGTHFENATIQGLDLLREMKHHPSAIEMATKTLLMLPSTDQFFKEAVHELHLGQIIQKPFSNELLMWIVRPLVFKASGAPIENFFMTKT